MSEQLRANYDQELRNFRRMAYEFANDNKVEAKLLGLDKDKCTDTHVERMIEAFALLTSRIRTKIDDDFPELTDAMFSVLYPHYLAPLPSMGIVQFEPPASASDLTKGLHIPKLSQLHAQEVPFEIFDADYGESRDTSLSSKIVSISCKYRTVYPTTVWPIKLIKAELRTGSYPGSWKTVKKYEANSILQLKFQVSGGKSFEDLNLSTLRLFLRGDDILTSSLYELLLNQIRWPATEPGLEGISFRNSADPQAQTITPLEKKSCFTPVGFEKDEGILPYIDHAFMGYRLLTEFFAYREKFLFVDLHGWQEARRGGALQSSEVEVLIYLKTALPNNLEQAINEKTFCLGATPIVNLFEIVPDAIERSHQRYDYPVRLPPCHEVIQIRDVKHTDPIQEETREYHPFYDFRHGDREHHRAYWYTKRRASLSKHDRGSHVDIHFCNMQFKPTEPQDPKVTLRALCCNRDVPMLLNSSSSLVKFEPKGFSAQVNMLSPVTETLRPYFNRGTNGNATFWKLLSHLNLNYLSLTGSNKDVRKRPLCEYLALYDFGDSASAATTTRVQEVIQGIVDIRSERIVELLRPQDKDGGFARGIKITLVLDEDKFTGIGAYLFANVMDHFLGLYASVNSFTKLVLETKQRGKDEKDWPIRSGDQQLI